MKPELDRPERAVARLKHRFDAFLSTFRRKKVSGAPVVVYNAICATALAASGMFESDYFPAHFLVDGHGSRYLAPVVDGYHRLAALYMSGAETEDCIFVWSNLYSINQPKTAFVVEGEAAGWDHRQIGALIEASVSELFDLTPEGVETGRSSARR
jgi:hypothetical protein